MYPTVLFLHSWVRWVVLLAALAVLGNGFFLAQCERAAASLRKLMRIFVSAFDVQVLLGLMLYLWLSPLVTSIGSGTPGWMKDPLLRFWKMEHITSMLIALVLAHLGAIKARNAATAQGARKWILWTTSLSLLLVLSSIPWPGRATARPLFRAPAASLAHP